MKEAMGGHHYRRLGVMFVLHFIAMYILMYAMVNSLTADVYNSLNQVYMAALMTASMGLIELALMGSIHRDKKRNFATVALGVITLVCSFTFIRQQIGISDKQFIRSMIPHHSGAILMCQKSAIQDAELQQLCNNIVASQQQEIDQMKLIFKRLRD